MTSLGLVTVTTHGTPVRLTSAATKCSQISIQPYRTLGASGTPPTDNTGTIYLMKGNNAKGANGANVLYVIEKGTPIFTIRSTVTCGLDASDYYLDSDTDGDGALVSCE